MMNTKGLTLQQMAVAVEIDRLTERGGSPPTTRAVGERRMVYSGYDRTYLQVPGYDATNSTIRRLVRRGIVEQAGNAHHGAATWKLTDEARMRLTEWRAVVAKAEAEVEA